MTAHEPVAPAGSNEPYLVVDDLTVRFPTHDGEVQAVTGLSYDIRAGRTLGIVGESGSGKSVAAMAILGLHDARRTRLSGSIKVGGTEVIGASQATLKKIRGRQASMVFQDPLTALHPFFTVGSQICEAYRLHHKVSKKAARARATEMLNLVGIPNAARRLDDYPHQFSGGMRQRAMIAVALVNNPRLLIADEPTTALDVTVQAQILDLIQELQKEFGSAVILITHDLGVIAEVADDIMVMYGGRCVERGSREQVLTNPQMPYTWGLLASVPDPESDPRVPLVPIPGTPPSLLNPPSGCAFHPRCKYAAEVAGNLCAQTRPELRPTGSDDHLVRCHLESPRP